MNLSRRILLGISLGIFAASSARAASPPECGRLAIALSEPAKYRPELQWATPECRDAVRAGRWPELAPTLARLAREPGLTWDAAATLCGMPVPGAEQEVIALLGDESLQVQFSPSTCLGYLFASDAPVARAYVSKAILAGDHQVTKELAKVPQARRDAFAQEIIDWYRLEPARAEHALSSLCWERTSSDMPVCGELAAAGEARRTEQEAASAKSFAEFQELERRGALVAAGLAREHLHDRLLRRFFFGGLSLIAAFVLSRIHLERASMREPWTGALAVAGRVHGTLYGVFVTAMVGGNLVRIVVLGLLSEAKGAEDAIAVFFGTGLVGIFALAITLVAAPIALATSWRSPAWYSATILGWTAVYAASLGM